MQDFLRKKSPAAQKDRAWKTVVRCRQKQRRTLLPAQGSEGTSGAKGSLGREVVAHATLGQDQRGAGGIVLDLLPQPPDGDVHRAHIVAYVVVVPDLLHEVGPGVHLPRVPRKEKQQLVFPLGQVHRGAVLGHLVVLRVDGQPARRDDRRGLLRPGLKHGGAADVGLHPGQQLPHGKGLGDVVVRPDFQAQHLVRLALPGGKDDHRHVVSLLPEDAAHVEAVPLGQHDVQQDQVRPLLPGGGQSRLAVISGEDGVALLLQVEAHDVHDTLLVLHDEDSFFLFHIFSFAAARQGGGF